LSNNAAKRSLQDNAIGRKNWTFAVSAAGGDRPGLPSKPKLIRFLIFVDQRELNAFLAMSAEHPSVR
jgi:hypothetical protein